MIENIVELEEHLEYNIDNLLFDRFGQKLKTISWDMVRGDCPLGWDVSVYFKGATTGKEVLDCIKIIYLEITSKNFTEKDFELAEIEYSNDWMKVSFQADIIGNKLC